MRQQGINWRRTCLNQPSRAAEQAEHRRIAGTCIVYGGKTLNAVRAELGQRERSLLLEGVDAGGNPVNAANADQCVFSLDVSLPTAAVFTWHGLGYTVLKCVPEDYGGETLGYNVTCYRTPNRAADPADAAQLQLWPAPPT